MKKNDLSNRKKVLFVFLFVLAGLFYGEKYFGQKKSEKTIEMASMKLIERVLGEDQAKSFRVEVTKKITAVLR